MKTFRIALTCLVHPTALVTVGLLLLNDHVLKANLPSWLTGKLSDFAGLFFFPFVLAAALAPVRLSARTTGAFAVALTGTWFTLIKITPEAAALTEAFVTRLTGWPARIVLDPTDLLALISLWPAWRVWARASVQRPQRSRPPRRVEWLALSAAALAALATTCVPIPSVDRIVAYEGALYARYAYYSVVPYSTDGGRTWNEMEREEAPAEVVQQLDNSNPLNQQLCDPLQPEVCYRLTGLPKIEQSLDGGATWQTSWELPTGRDDFMRRYLNPPDAFEIISVCSSDEVATTPTSLAIVTLEGRSWLVAALGTEGVLLRTPQGNWERVTVLEAGPTPYWVSDARAFSLMLHEAVNWLGGALLTFWLITAWHMRAALTATHSYRTHFVVRAGVFITAALLLVWFIFTALFPDAAEAGYLWPLWLIWAVINMPLYVFLGATNNFWLMLVVIVVMGLIVFGLLRLIVGFWRSIDWPTVDARVTRTGLVMGVATLILSYLPFPFWAWGLIAHYDIARYLALAATGLVWLIGGVWLRRLRAPAK